MRIARREEDDGKEEKKEYIDGQIKIRGGNLKMNMSVWKWLHNDTLKRIAKHLAKLLSFEEIMKCDDVVLVGGFANSFFLVEYLTKCFPHIRFFLPRDPHLTVVKGKNFILSLSRSLAVFASLSGKN